MTEEEREEKDTDIFERAWNLNLPQTSNDQILTKAHCLTFWLISRKELREEVKKMLDDYFNDPEFDVTPLMEFVNPKLKEYRMKGE